MPQYSPFDHSVPLWQRAGFPSQQAFEAVYGVGATSTASNPTSEQYGQTFANDPANTGGLTPTADAAPPPADTGGSADTPYGIDQLLQQLAAQQPAQAQTAPPSLASDPAYLAFQRALGAERTTAQRNTQDQTDAINRSTALRLPQLAEQAAYGRERISGSYEDRGLLRSSQHETALARAREAEGNASANLQDQASQRIAALQQGLAGQETGFDTRLAEQNLAAAQRQQDFTANQQQQSSYQQQVAAQLAAQRQQNDAVNARYDRAISQYGLGGGPGATSTQAPAAAPANPLAGVVGIVPEQSDPDYAIKLAQLRLQGAS